MNIYYTCIERGVCHYAIVHAAAGAFRRKGAVQCMRMRYP